MTDADNKSPLTAILDAYRNASVTEREKGTYFEELTICYLRNEATYKDLYSDVWTYSQWAELQGIPKNDAGIDLVAKTADTGELHAIQCKLYAPTYRLQKSDIDSFFTASGKKIFSRRVIVSTTNNWSDNAENALIDQQPPVTKIDLHDLENSQIDWAKYQPNQAPVLKPKKSLRPHQQSALNATLAGFERESRGKLIMACGTGKTFTSLKIAEAYAGAGKRVLFLVPSLSLLSQTLTEWTQESTTPLHSFAVCSDSDVGKHRKKDDDVVQTFTHELRYPATTDPARLALEMGKRHDDAHMSVVFSTYHSIDTISKAQKENGLPAFDLIICDEAHRTTGATFDDDDESNFVKVHDAGFIQAGKRLYMTATPRIYGNNAKASAEKDNVVLCSMDDENLYGPELYVITFSEAVRLGLLCDYKVIVLSVEESHVNRRIQELLRSADNDLRVDDAAKIIGCWKALAKQELTPDLIGDTNPMKRAVAFCQVIETNKGAKVHKVSSKNIATMFQAVVQAYQDSENLDDEELQTSPAYTLQCEAEHVDGGMNASAKESKLAWLKDEPPENTCRILSNVRCLSEGVDVPALDAVLFLTPRNSQVDVVQSVGRVMRNAPGKKRGYVVLPVVIPAGVEPHEALNDNKTYKVVWEVLQALRSHDDKFDAMVNKLELVGNDRSKIEIIAVSDKIQQKSKRKKDENGVHNKTAGRGGSTIGRKEATGPSQEEMQGELQFEVGEIEKAIYAKLVQKVGNRHHWEDWANDIAKIARTHIDRIQGILENPANTTEKQAFDAFAVELRDDLNGSISDGEIVEMLAQHLITKPVFDALFADYSFAEHNPMSKAMQGVLEALHEHRLDKEADTLQKFYDSVKIRAEGIDSAAGKQRIIVELYDKFFANAFPKLRDKLGIVYTPVEVVDFILHSVNHLLHEEFDQALGSEGVHIIDPFTGTGTFITRLLQSGLISPEELPHKYKHEIHANEIVLLAYYIAAINIEASYHSLVGGKYVPFEGICLTDTFQMYEKDDLVSALTVDNSARRKRQKKLDIRVIVGNPPYSVGQKDDNDDAANVKYKGLDERIQKTYVAKSTGNPRSLYNSSIRAYRWASDRIGESGVIAFVSDAGYIEGKAADGFRKVLVEEFTSIYVFNLRGNQRTSGELSRKEGGKIFGSGSRSPIAINILVKNPAAKAHRRILYHDIGDYLDQKSKLKIIDDFKSVAGITLADGWHQINPDAYGDWLNQRDDSIKSFICMGDKKDKAAQTIFTTYSSGVKTNRDAWVYNASKSSVLSNIRGMVNFYNQSIDKNEHSANLNHSTKISWSWVLRGKHERGIKGTFDVCNAAIGLYRPFEKTWHYYEGFFNENRYLMPRIFPTAQSENLVICVTGLGENKDFSSLITNAVPNLHLIAGSQCFPMWVYESSETKEQGCDDERPDGGKQQPELFSEVSGDLFESTALHATASKCNRRDAITDVGLAHFQDAYPGDTLSKEDLFYYVYGLLHSPDYRERYADNLSKELPRIPRVKTAADFWAFSRSGRTLAEWHLNYETVQPYPLTIEVKGPLTDADYRVEKMKFAKKGDKSTVIYNGKITLRDIPAEAWNYVVNGKAALDWVMERQSVKTDPASGIVNDANDWAIETMGNPKYPLELFQRVVTVSLETQKIVAALPKLDI